MAPKQKRKVGESSSTVARENSSVDPRFPSEFHKHQFQTNTFQLMPTRSLDHKFFNQYAPLVMQVIGHYRLQKLVYCVHDINLDLVTEFYNNLQPTGDRLIYKSRVAKTNISFTPEILRAFLDCRESTSTLECYPSIQEPSGNFSILDIHQSFFNRPRQPGVNLFPAMSLAAPDNVLYKVIVGCILPIVSRGQAKIRSHHLVALHFLKNQLDLNIALNIFLCITHFSVPVHKKIYMPFAHIITFWLESLGIDTSRGTVQKMSDKFDIIRWRNFSLAGMSKGAGNLRWADNHQAGEQWDTEEQAVEPPLEEEDEPSTSISEQLTHIRSDIEDLDIKVEGLEITMIAVSHQVADLNNRQTRILDQQEEILRLVRSLASPGSSSQPPQ